MSDVSWLWIDAFWLLWILPAIAIFGVVAHQRTRRAATRLIGDVMGPRLLPNLGGGGPALKMGLFGAGMACVILALARPSWDFDYKKVVRRGVDVVVALDVSRSMLADDGGESRLERAKASLSDLVTTLVGDRFQLMGFAGDQVVASAPTFDRGYLQQALAELSPESVGRGGTQIGPALDRALELLDRQHGREKIVVLVTDAGDQDSFPETAAGHLAKKKVRVVTVGVGRTGSNLKAPLVIDGQVVRDKSGNVVLARVNTELLTRIANRTRGVFIPPEQVHRLAELYRTYVDPLPKGEERTMVKKEPRERYFVFLIPGLLLLLVSAGVSPYPRRRRRHVGGVTATVLLTSLLVLAGCGDGDDAETVQAATIALRDGDAASAVRDLETLSEEREDDPVVLYDLGCAYLGADRREDARRVFGQVLALGEQTLRARAEVNLALLDLADLEGTVEHGVAGAGAEVRAEIRAHAGRVLDRLQHARDLDADLEEARMKQDIVAAWLRVTEDLWATADRDAAREARLKKQGALYLMELIAAQSEIGRAIPRGTRSLAHLALDQRDLVVGLDVIEEKLGDDAPAVSDESKASILEDVARVRPILQATEDNLKEARPEEGVVGAGRAGRALVNLYALWAEPGDVVARLRGEQAGLAQALSRLAQAPMELRSREILATVSETQRDLGLGIGRVLARLEQADPEAWHPVWVAFAKDELARARDGMREVASSIAPDLQEAGHGAAGVDGRLQRVADDWNLSRLEAAQLARDLESRQRDMSRAIVAADPLVLASAGPSPESLVADQVRRIGYCSAALRKEVMKNAPEEPTEDQVQAQENRLKQLVGLAEQARAADESALAALAQGGFPPGDDVLVPLGTARHSLRSLWLLLSSFEQLLEAAAQQQAAAAAIAASAIELMGDDDARFPQELRQAPLLLTDQSAEQDLVTGLAQRLVKRLPAERDRQRGQAGAADASGAEPAADALDAKAVADALDAMEDLLTSAHGEAEAASSSLRENRSPAAVGDLKKVLDVARPRQVRAAELLADALDELRKAKLPLPEIARALMVQDAALLPLARRLGVGEAIKQDGKEISPEDLVAALDEGSVPLVARLPSALERALATMKEGASQGGRGATGGGGSEQEEAAAQLSAMTDLLSRFQNEARAAFAKPDPKPGLESLDRGRAVARQIWAAFADVEALLRQGIAEETLLIGRTQGLRDADAAVSDVRLSGAVTDQGVTRELIPLLEGAIQRAVESQAQQQGQQPGGAPAGGGLSEGFVELAKTNLPRTDEAMQEAERELGQESWTPTLENQEKAKRLLEELLKKLQEDQEEDQDQQQQQPQPQQQQQNLSQSERDRQRRAVDERNKKLQDRRREHRSRTAVVEDW